MDEASAAGFEEELGENKEEAVGAGEEKRFPAGLKGEDAELEPKREELAALLPPPNTESPTGLEAPPPNIELLVLVFELLGVKEKAALGEALTVAAASASTSSSSSLTSGSSSSLSGSSVSSTSSSFSSNPSSLNISCTRFSPDAPIWFPDMETRSKLDLPLTALTKSSTAFTLISLLSRTSSLRLG